MDEINNRMIGNPLTVNVFGNAICVPLKMAQSDIFGFNFGAFSSDGMPLESFRLRRSWGTSQEPDFQDADSLINESVTYGGILLPHFGHFLLESLSRLWCLREATTGSIVWHARTSELRGWQKEILQLVGVPVERFAYIRNPTRFKEIFVPDPGFQIGLSFNPLQAKALAVFPCGNPDSGRRIWLSRTKLPSGHGQVLEENQIEQRLRERGWDIVYPETLPIAKQLEHLASAATVAGFEGSAFHALVLARDFNAEVRIIARSNKPNPNYELIASTKGLRQKILQLPLKLNSGAGPRATWNLYNVDEVIDFVH